MWTVDDKMKALSSDDTLICIGRGDDASTFVWCRSNETWSYIIDDMGLMSGTSPGELAVITSTANAQVDNEILDFSHSIIWKKIWLHWDTSSGW